MLKRESIGTLVLTEDDNLTGLTHRTEIDDPPSFLQEYSESFLERMSPPRTTKVYKVWNGVWTSFVAFEYSRR